jgi:DNA-binding CsgD family transcriptional regulator
MNESRGAGFPRTNNPRITRAGLMASAKPAKTSADEYRAEFAAVFDARDPRPRIVVDDGQRVLWCCDDARRLLERPLPLSIRKGRLIVDDALRPGFADFLNNAGPNVQHKLLRVPGQRHWVLLRAWQPPHWQRKVCLLPSPSWPLVDIVASGLAGELKLTNAEVRVLKEFAELNPPKQIARDLGVSLSTVRSHLKQIHAKAEVTTSLQLLRLAHTYCST